MDSGAPLLSQIQQCIAEGRLVQAEALARSLLEQQPDHPFALSFLASRAMEAGDLDRSIDLSRRAADAYPHKATLRQNLGIAELHAGRAADAAATFARALKVDPQAALVYLYLSESLRALGETRKAGIAVNRGFKLDPRLRSLADLQGVPPNLQQLGRAAVQFWREYSHEQHRQVIEGAMESLSPRFERFLQLYDGLRDDAYQDPMQRPNYQYFPGLEFHPWWDAECFEWVKAYEEGYPDVRAELLQVLERTQDMKPYVEGLHPEAPEAWKRLEDSLTWSSYHLFKGGERIDENCAACPRTVERLESLPLATAKGHAPEAFFSILKPGTHIPPHYGLSNTKLTVHLPLVVPPDCSIRVGNEERSWQEGKVMIFDDSYQHEAWNRSRETRIVLITEVWNPDLTPEEQRALSAVIEWDTDFHAEVETFDPSA